MRSLLIPPRWLMVMAALVALAASAARLAAQPTQPLDLVLAGGRVVDGAGGPWCTHTGVRAGRVLRGPGAR